MKPTIRIFSHPSVWIIFIFIALILNLSTLHTDFLAFEIELLQESFLMHKLKFNKHVLDRPIPVLFWLSAQSHQRILTEILNMWQIKYLYIIQNSFHIHLLSHYLHIQRSLNIPKFHILESKLSIKQNFILILCVQNITKNQTIFEFFLLISIHTYIIRHYKQKMLKLASVWNVY